MTKVVMDTNCLVSAIGWDGPPHRILLACLRGTLELCISPAILEELTKVLSRPRLAVIAAHPDLPTVLSWLHTSTHLVFPSLALSVVAEDPDDNHIIECAVESGAEAVITGDDHLASIKSYQGILFLRPTEACERFGI
ncbi:MAG: putative toxin-antitoxin system toxin component, PIN family [Bacillota bacterium]